MFDDLKALEGVSVPSMIDIFKSWVQKTFTPAYQKKIDAYLDKSIDHCDLEHRMSTLIRRGLL
jgi:hypothetical protein